MEAKPSTIPNSSLSLLFLSAVVVSVCARIQCQTLDVRPLPRKQTSKSDITWTGTRIAGLPETTEHGAETANHILLPLKRIDALVPNNLTAHEKLKLQLARDACRVQSILASVVRACDKSEPKNYYANNKRKKNGTIPVVAGSIYDIGEFLVPVSVGTPSQYFLFIMDTGSDLIWTQALPCESCHTQLDSLFDPEMSNTYESISCTSEICTRHGRPICESNKCNYEVRYGGGFSSKGELATETLSIGGNVIEKVVMGLAHDNRGLSMVADGLLGLSQGSLSFPSQTIHKFKAKFSYCLADMFYKPNGSWLSFGHRSIPRTISFTPIIPNAKIREFYYVELTRISVGGSLVPGIDSTLFKFDERGRGGVIVDSGTTVTYLTPTAYGKLRDAFREEASHLNSTEGVDVFDTCYHFADKEHAKVPVVEFHFRGANVILPETSLMILMDTSGIYCFPFAASRFRISIIGNIQQQGFMMVYDLENSSPSNAECMMKFTFLCNWSSSFYVPIP